MKALGRADTLLKLSVARRVFALLVLTATLPFGIVPIICGQVLQGIVAFLVTAFFAGKLTRFGVVDQLRQMLPAVLASIVMLVIVAFVGSRLRLTPALTLASLTLVGVSTYLIICATVRLPGFTDGIAIVSRKT